MKIITLSSTFLLIFMTSLSLSAQQINWITFADLPDSLRVQPKPILIFIHTEWCKYCALQDHNTFRDAALSQLLNRQYYALRLNAEETRDITLLGRTYQGRTNGSHELAEFLGKEDWQLSFPTTIILAQDLRLRNRLVGFVAADDLLFTLRITKPGVF